MIIRYGNCEYMSDWYGNKPKVFMYNWKLIHLGIVKIWLGYQWYRLVNNKENEIVKTNKGKTIVGKHCNQIEIKWAWK